MQTRLHVDQANKNSELWLESTFFRTWFAAERRASSVLVLVDKTGSLQKCCFPPPSTSNYEEGWQLRWSDDGSSSCGWWRAGVPTGRQPWLSASLCLRQEVKMSELEWWFTGWLKSEMCKTWNEMCDGGQREHTNLCQADLATVASYSYTTLHCIFLPCSLSFHLCISFSLLTQGLAPSPRYPLRWIYQKSGQRPSLSSGLDQIYLGLRALVSALFLRGGWGLEREFLTKLWWLKDIWDGGGWGIPYRTYPSFLYLYTNLFSPLESKQSRKKITISPWPCDR